MKNAEHQRSQESAGLIPVVSWLFLMKKGEWFLHSKWIAANRADRERRGKNCIVLIFRS